MTNKTPAFICSLLLSASLFLPQAALAEIEASTLGLRNESELGVVLVEGNAQTQTLNLSQQTSYGWSGNLLRLTGRYLKAKARAIETSRFWLLGMRYERELSPRFSAISSYNIESDIFAGYDPRHNVDLGGKYYIVKNESINWLTEAGYRLTSERKVQEQVFVPSHFARLYTEIDKKWSDTAVAKFWFEYLPNFTDFRGYRFNTELSTTATLNKLLSLKLAYLVRYNNQPVAAGAYRADRFFTTSLVARF